MAAMIANEPDMTVIGEAADGAAAVELYAPIVRPLCSWISGCRG